MGNITQKLKNSQAKKAIILGSGVSVFDGIDPIASIKYSELPNWPLGKVKGHKGVLDIYENLWVLRGRAHIYEGFSWQDACFPTQFLADQGIQELICTNAAGGINPDFEIGDLMQITGYVNFLKPGLARGNLDAISNKVQILDGFSKATEKPRNENLHRGVYVGVHGPNYETDAEISMFRSMGCDAVGMSTIPEIETAQKNKMQVSAFSIITNVYGKTEDLGHDGVVKVAKETSKKLSKFLGLN